VGVGNLPATQLLLSTTVTTRDLSSRNRSLENVHRRARFPAGLQAITILAVAAGLLVAAAPAAATLTCERVPELLRTYLQKHIDFHYLNDELRERAIDAYVKRIDPSKSLLLAAEAKQLRASLGGIFHDVKNGDCTDLQKLQMQTLERYSAMETFVKEYVGSEDYELDTDVTLIIDPDKRGHPKTEAERKELIKKLVHFQMSNYLSSDMEMAEAKEKLTHRYELMTRRASELEQHDVYGAFLDAFASSLDPHSNYLSAETLEDFQIGMGLSLEGIGVALSSRDGYSVVEKIIPGGAANKVDALLENDKIIAVAQEEGEFIDIIDMDLRDVVRLIRGKRGTKVHLTVLRQGENTERFQVTIVRDKIDLEEQAAKLSFEDVDVDGQKFKLAVLELPSFYGGRNPTDRQSSRDVKNLLKQVKEAKADGLLLDLSRNGGGLLENSVEIAGFFIDQGGVVAVKDTLSKVNVLKDPDSDIVYDGPMVVLTSRVSASASEIVAGAMKDYRRAVVVGDDHTFGKGTVQSMVPLPSGLGALKVTTALFFRPGGESTQHEGVPADIVLPSLFATDDFGEKHQPYSLPQQRIEPFLGKDVSEVIFSSSEKPVTLAWQPVQDELVEQLSSRSAERVTHSEEFAEIQRKVEESQKRKGVIRLSEMLEEQERAEAENGSAGDNEAEEPTAKGITEGAIQHEPEAAIKANAGEVMQTPPAEVTKKDAREQTPQQREALLVLADFVALSRTN